MVKKPLLGLWEVDVNPVTVGGAVMFVEELLSLSEAQNLSPVSLCFISVTPFLTASHPLYSLLPQIEGIHYVFERPSIESVKKEAKEDTIPWPSWEPGKHDYQAGFRLREFFAEQGNLPVLMLKEKLMSTVKDWMDKKSDGRIPVSIHLKNNPDAPGQSNANFGEWYEFMQSAQQSNEVCFFLMGSDKIEDRFRELSNVVVTQDHRFDLGRDAAVILASSAFMGMASGPCQIAVFSPIPYMIYKNPGHHTEEMEKELNGKDHFSFASPNQKIKLENETADMLASDLEWMLTRKIGTRL